MAKDDNLTKLHVSHALGKSSTRVAALIVESGSLAAELIEEQPSAVVEALIEFWSQRARSEKRAARRALQEATVKYCEAALGEARARERRLLQGITGIGDEPEIA
jgi:chorismate synthase